MIHVRGSMMAFQLKTTPTNWDTTACGPVFAQLKNTVKSHQSSHPNCRAVHLKRQFFRWPPTLYLASHLESVAEIDSTPSIRLDPKRLSPFPTPNSMLIKWQATKVTTREIAHHRRHHLHRPMNPNRTKKDSSTRQHFRPISSQCGIIKRVNLCPTTNRWSRWRFRRVRRSFPITVTAIVIIRITLKEGRSTTI